MAREHFKELVIRYADGRPICNCGQAYYTPCGEGYLNGERRTDMLICRYGCSAAQIDAKNEIAERVLKELQHNAELSGAAKRPLE